MQINFTESYSNLICTEFRILTIIITFNIIFPKILLMFFYIYILYFSSNHQFHSFRTSFLIMQGHICIQNKIVTYYKLFVSFYKMLLNKFKNINYLSKESGGYFNVKSNKNIGGMDFSLDIISTESPLWLRCFCKFSFLF